LPPAKPFRGVRIPYPPQRISAGRAAFRHVSGTRAKPDFGLFVSQAFPKRRARRNTVMGGSQKRRPRSTTGSITRLPSGRYHVRYTDPAGVRRSLPGTSPPKGEASAALARVTVATTDGTWLPPEQAAQTVGEYAQAWISRRTAFGGLKPATVALYQELIRDFIVSPVAHRTNPAPKPPRCTNVCWWGAAVISVRQPRLRRGITCCVRRTDSRPRPHRTGSPKTHAQEYRADAGAIRRPRSRIAPSKHYPPVPVRRSYRSYARRGLENGSASKTVLPNPAYQSRR